MFWQRFDDSGGKGKNKKYKVEEIWDSAVYTKKSKSYLSGFYYLIL